MVRRFGDHTIQRYSTIYFRGVDYRSHASTVLRCHYQLLYRSVGAARAAQVLGGSNGNEPDLIEVGGEAEQITVSQFNNSFSWLWGTILRVGLMEMMRPVCLVPHFNPRFPRVGRPTTTHRWLKGL